MWLRNIWEFLVNFISGIYLQVDRPFDHGEQIVLPKLKGKDYEIRQIGNRITNLYIVDEHTEVSMPNTNMADITIRNISQPEEKYDDKEKKQIPKTDNENKDL